MSPRTYKWLLVAALVVTGLIAIAREVRIPIIDQAVHPKTVIECQDSPRCREFFADKLHDAIAPLKAELRKLERGGSSSGSPPTSPGGGGPSAAPPGPPNQPPPSHPPPGHPGPSGPPGKPAPTPGQQLHRVCHQVGIEQVCDLVPIAMGVLL